MTYQDGCRAIPVETSWRLIQPHIKPGWLVFDIGAAEGWFTRALADMGCIAVGFDHSAEMDAEGRDCLLVRRKVTSQDLFWLSECPNTIDAILALNVLHHMAPDELDAFVANAARVSHTLIVEFPETSEPSTLGYAYQGQIGDLLRQHYAQVEMVGQNEVGPNHQRQVWVARNDTLTNRALYTTFGSAKVQPATGRRHPTNYNGDWWLTKGGDTQAMIRGICVDTLLHWDVCYPAPAWWADAADRAVHEKVAEQGHIDNIAPLSLIYTGAGIEMIDCAGYEQDWKADLDRLQAVLAEFTIEAYIREYSAARRPGPAAR